MRRAFIRTSRRCFLDVQSLEDRSTPAVVAYTAGTLTVTAATGDVIQATLNSTDVPGFLDVTNGPISIFNSSTNRPVHNLVVKAGTATSYSLDVSSTVSLTDLKITGASVATGVSLGAGTVVNRNLSFTGNSAAAADDTILVPAGTRIGGNATFALKGGTNTLNFSGKVGGNVVVSALGGADTINIADSGPLTVGRNLAFNLGNGLNKISGTVNSIAVGGNLTYIGGLDDDLIDVTLAPLRVGKNVTLNLSSATTQNSWGSGPLQVGRNFTANGGNGNENLRFNGASEVGGNVSTSLGGGSNFFAVGYSFAFASVFGGSINYAGFDGIDSLYLDNLVVGKNVTASFGGGSGQAFYFGTRQGAFVQIGRSVTVAAGNGADFVNIYLARVGGAINLNTGGGNDTIQIDDTNVNGPVSVDLGDGDDKLRLDTQADNGTGTLLSGFVRLTSTLTVFGRDGVDLVDLSAPPAGNKVMIGGNIKLVGGTGVDHFVHWTVGNLYLSSSKFEDFETGDSF